MLSSSTTLSTLAIVICRMSDTSMAIMTIVPQSMATITSTGSTNAQPMTTKTRSSTGLRLLIKSVHTSLASIWLMELIRVGTLARGCTTRTSRRCTSAHTVVKLTNTLVLNMAIITLRRMTTTTIRLPRSSTTCKTLWTSPIPSNDEISSLTQRIIMHRNHICR